MLFFRKKTAEEKKIETLINDLKLYLENNYKDLAISSRKEAVELVEQYYRQGKLKKKKYESYSQLLEVYTKEMTHYNHQEFYHS